ncbi:MAG: hypothetical protein RLZZ574_2987 [Cyanobacteriota bacterium]
MLELTNLQPKNIELSSQQEKAIKGGIEPQLLNDDYWARVNARTKKILSAPKLQLIDLPTYT